jgi:hypothetical protein
VSNAEGRARSRLAEINKDARDEVERTQRTPSRDIVVRRPRTKVVRFG